MNLAVTKFTYVSTNSKLEDSFTSAEGAPWAGQTSSQSPFFLVSTPKQVTFYSGNALFGDSGLSLSVKENSLSAKPEKWYTQSEFNINSKQIVQDQTSSGYLSLDLSFDQGVTMHAQLLSDIDLIIANSFYSFESCIAFTDPIINLNTGVANQEQVQVYLRQKKYPFKPLTNKETITGLIAQPCKIINLSTLDNLLFLDIKDYAQLVIDFTNYKQESNSAFKVSLSKVKLTSKAKPATQANLSNTTPTTQYNDTFQIEYITEGWASKYTSANVGFAIVVSILIIGFVVIFYLFMTNFKRIKA